MGERFDLLDKQKELTEKGQFVNEQSVDNGIEEKFCRYLQEHGLRITPNFMIGNIRYDFRVWQYPLLIEIDGNVHNSCDKRERDYLKDRLALKNGYKVIRYSARDANNNLNEIIKEIYELIDAVGKIPRQFYYPTLTWKYVFKQIKGWFVK